MGCVTREHNGALDKVGRVKREHAKWDVAQVGCFFVTHMLWALAWIPQCRIKQPGLSENCGSSGGSGDSGGNGSGGSCGSCAGTGNGGTLTCS